jgi:hypothetical protein
VAEAILDGAPMNPRAIPVATDGATHTLHVVLGDRRPKASVDGGATGKELEGLLSR